MSGINIFTKKPRPLPPPDLGCETDCEDQGMTLIKDGCFTCPPKIVHVGNNFGKLIRPKFTKRQSPGNSSLKGGGPWYWYCEGCKGYFGEARAPRHAREPQHYSSSTKESK